MNIRNGQMESRLPFAVNVILNLTIFLLRNASPHVKCVVIVF